MFGQSLRKPQRATIHVGDSPLSEGPSNLVELEDMHEFVVENSIELGIGTTQGECDSPLEKLGEARDPFGQHPGDHVGLFEVDVGGVQNQRNSPLNRVRQLTFYSPITRLGGASSKGGQLALLLVEVDIEVNRLQTLPGKLVELHLVLAEPV